MSGLALVSAAEYGHVEIVRMLLMEDGRIDPGMRGNVVLRRAAANGHLAVVELLLLYPRTDPSDFHNDAVKRATRNGHVHVVARLLADPRV